MDLLSINKRIAELKGFKPGPSGSLRYTNSVSLHPVSMPDNLLSIFAKEDKSWAENISDAWELFEEMPYTTNITKIASKENCDYLFYQCSIDLLNIKDIAGSAPLAICLAWIKWKER